MAMDMIVVTVSADDSNINGTKASWCRGSVNGDDDLGSVL